MADNTIASNDEADEFEMYIAGMSIPEVSEKTGIPKSTLRKRFEKAGILRSRADGIRNAVKTGRLVGQKGVKKNFTEEWIENIRKAKQISGLNKSTGIDYSRGYPRFTRGKYKGRFVHQVVMELWLGRELQGDECIHHIDGDRKNNSLNNLALMTISGHSRLHHYQDAISGKTRKRKAKEVA